MVGPSVFSGQVATHLQMKSGTSAPLAPLVPGYLFTTSITKNNEGGPLLLTDNLIYHLNPQKPSLRDSNLRKDATDPSTSASCIYPCLPPTHPHSLLEMKAYPL